MLMQNDTDSLVSVDMPAGPPEVVVSLLSSIIVFVYDNLIHL